MKTRLIFVLKATVVSLVVLAIAVLATLLLLLSDPDPLTALVGLVLVLCSLAGFFVVAWNQREQP